LILVLQGRDVDLLFGLDMLKAHQAIIDLQKNVLRIQGREVKFLAEHELPDKARIIENAEINDTMPVASTSEATRRDSRRGSPSRSGHFPGSGHTLGRTPRPSQQSRGASRSRQSSLDNGGFPERDIATVVGLGVSREVAIRTLRLAAGNVDVAASFLFDLGGG
jgi:DNA damage-inducible protein 1